MRIWTYINLLTTLDNMAIFIIMFILLGIMMIPELSRHKTKIALLCFLLLWLIQALRALEIGCDSYYAYIPHFINQGDVDVTNIIQSPDRYKFEPGYHIYTRIIRYFSHSSQIFISITSLIIIGLITIVFRKYSKNTPLSFIIFAGLILYHFSFSGLRQSIALAITFFSTIFIYKRKPLIFIGLVLLAFTFHKSSIIFLPAYALYNIHISRKLIIISGITIVIFFAMAGPVAEYVRNIIFGADKYSGYLGANVGAFGLTILYILLTVFILNTSEWNDKHQNFLCWMAIMTLMFQPLGMVSQAADRIGYYFVIYFTLSIPTAVDRLKPTKLNRCVINYSILVFMMFFFWYCNASGYLDVVPYKFYWE